MENRGKKQNLDAKAHSLDRLNLSAKAQDLDLNAKVQGPELKPPTSLDHLTLNAEAQDVNLSKYQS